MENVNKYLKTSINLEYIVESNVFTETGCPGQTKTLHAHLDVTEQYFNQKINTKF